MLNVRIRNIRFGAPPCVMKGCDLEHKKNTLNWIMTSVSFCIKLMLLFYFSHRKLNIYKCSDGLFCFWQKLKWYPVWSTCDLNSKIMFNGSEVSCEISLNTLSSFQTGFWEKRQLYLHCLGYQQNLELAIRGAKTDVQKFTNVSGSSQISAGSQVYYIFPFKIQIWWFTQ